MALLMISGLLLMAFNPPTASAAGSSETPTYVNPYNATATPSADGAIYHTVLEGQVLYTIATLYGIDVNSLLANNNLEWTSIINIGDILLIRNANERLPGEVLATPTPAAGSSNAGTPVAGGVGTADTVGSLGGGANGTAPGGSLGSGTGQDLGAAAESEGLEPAMFADTESGEGMGSSYEQIQAQMIGQFSLSGALVNLAGTPVPPELAMSAALNGEAYILLPDGESGLRTATAVSESGVVVLTIGEKNALAIPAIQAAALAPNTEKLAKNPDLTPNLVERIFSNNTKYLALAVILMVLIGLLLLVISTRRLRQ
jgi:LysM repeat protein